MAKKHEMRKATRNLPCALTPTEMDQRRDRLAMLHQEKDQLEQEKSDAAKAFNDKLKTMETEMSQLAREIREKAEYRDIEVKWVRDFNQKTKDLIRADTGEVVDSEALGPDEMQVEMQQGYQ